jgi:hypothetical protein
MKKVLIGLVILLAIIVIFLVYSGLFSTITIVEKEIGPYTLVFEEYRGDYSNAGTIFRRVYDVLEKDYGIKPERGFGIYYDDPRTVPKEKLRSDVGCVINARDAGKLNAAGAPFKVRGMKKTMSVAADFPFRSMVSVYVGVMRVYPKMDAYIKDRKLATEYSMELYDFESKKILYAFPIKK